jgi:hypothetical protein
MEWVSGQHSDVRADLDLSLHAGEHRLRRALLGLVRLVVRW